MSFRSSLLKPLGGLVFVRSSLLALGGPSRTSACSCVGRSVGCRAWVPAGIASPPPRQSWTSRSCASSLCVGRSPGIWTGGLLSANLPYTHSKNKLQNKLPGGSGRPGRNLNQSDLAPGRPLNLQFVFGVCVWGGGWGYRLDFQVANRDPNLGVAGWALGGAGVARLLHRIGEIPIRNRDFPEMNNRGNSK